LKSNFFQMYASVGPNPHSGVPMFDQSAHLKKNSFPLSEEWASRIRKSASAILGFKTNRGLARL
jgi:hypothetical protein